MQTYSYHIPVMLNEALEGLNINPDGVYVDLTFGGGGHSRAILERLSSCGELYAFDKDEDAIKNALDDERFCLIHDDYTNIGKQLRLYRKTKVDGILADLGISSHQIDEAERGFSTNKSAPLDLRMDRRNSLMASDIVNTYDKEQLKFIFKTYAELSNSGLLADRIVRQREEKSIETTSDLIEIIEPLALKGRENKYYAKVFQALRIEVNNELKNLEDMLLQCASLLKEGGRLVIISYHSLEDRLVKNLLKSGNTQGKVEKDFYGNVISPYKIITRKPLQASEEEIMNNPRSRSAKLRVGEKIGGGNNG
ncbi:MAG: 16S rRNA (cytosine(1402)-N(4))-methyltransferase RsmH [Bacteroidales bacterium]|nr:16S rRNA (cytosine(1402)-N(4))-methyltransferase RsmH [Bacteroidales bacterium]